MKYKPDELKRDQIELENKWERNKYKKNELASSNLPTQQPTVKDLQGVKQMFEFFPKLDSSFKIRDSGTDFEF